MQREHSDRSWVERGGRIAELGRTACLYVMPVGKAPPLTSPAILH